MMCSLLETVTIVSLFAVETDKLSLFTPVIRFQELNYQIFAWYVQCAEIIWTEQFAAELFQRKPTSLYE